MGSTQSEEIYIKVQAQGIRSAYDKEWDDGSGGDLKHICVWHGDAVYAIQTAYARQGTTKLSSRHGGNLGNFDIVCFNEPLTRVSGHYEYYDTNCWDPEVLLLGEEAARYNYNYTKVISSLTFGTRQATYGPFGRERGTPFHFNISTGFGGFHGSSDSEFLTTLGVYAKTKATLHMDGPSGDAKAARQ